MKLTIDYLNGRHEYWKHRIGESGIWKAEAFKPVTIVIRPDCKSYNGLFIRRFVRKKGVREILDRIFIYNKTEDFNTRFLDSVLVHEMMHQYIIQNGIKDTSTHGKVFKELMSRINEAFREELLIKVSDHNPSVPLSGKGDKLHTLLFLRLEKDICYLCVVNPSKKKDFEGMLRKNKSLWKVKSYFWTESDDVHFNRFRRCTRSLHGIKKSYAEMIDFCKAHNVSGIEN